MKQILSIALSLILMLGITASVQAQERVVSGVITADDGLPMPGVTVLDKTNQTGTTTNIDGEYSIQVGPNSVLVFSFIGYATQEVTVGNQSKIDIELVEDTNELSEFVVSAFGMEKEQKKLGYATTTIQADELIKVGTPNVATALYGKAPGVRIQSGAGGATSAVNITIRGLNSITGNTQPLIIMDGVPIRNENVTNNNYWGDQRLRGNGLLDINPEDIANISILKGASAAALYGSEAVNGVVLITTKKGNSGKKGFSVDFSANVARDEIAYLPRYQNVRGPGAPLHVYDYGQDDDGFFTYDDGVRGLASTNNNFGPEFDGRMVRSWDGEMRPYVAQEDNYAALFNNPLSSSVNVAVANNSEFADFRFSLTRQDNEALSLNSKNNKNIANLNATFRITDRWKTDVMVNYINQNTKNRPYSIDRMINNFGGMMTRFDNGDWYLDNYQTSRGYKYVVGQNTQSLTPDENIIYNGFMDAIGDYVWRVNKHNLNETSNRVISVLTNTYKITDDLSLRGRISTDFTNRYSEDKRATERPLAFGNSGMFSMNNETFNILYGDVFLTYTKNLAEDISISAMAGYTGTKETRRELFTRTNGGLSSENLFDLIASNQQVVSNATRSNRVIDALVGTANFDYKGFWFLEGTIRRDRTSTMNPENNSFVYPSVNTSLAISEMVEMPQFITFAKLRGSWGIVGNYPGLYRANIAYTQNTLDGVLYTVMPSSFGNDGIRPEQKHEYEIGLDARFFGNRLGIDLSYYNAQIRDQILPLTLPNTSGASSVLTNIGTLRNKGVEMALNATIMQSGSFMWDMTLNLARNINTVEKLANDATELLHADYDGGAAQLRSVVGRPMGDLYAHPIETDANGDNIVQPNGLYKIDANNWKRVGNYNPDAVGGLMNNLSYKNFTFSAMMDFQIGGSVMPTGINWMKSRGLTEESLKFRNEETGGLAYYRVTGEDGITRGVQVDHSTTAGPNGEAVFHDGMLMDGVTADGQPNTNVISQALYYNATYNWGGPQYSQSRYELYIQDNTYLKMRELSLGYTLPQSFAQRIGASNVNVSVFGRNLFFLYRNIKDLDPEVLTAGSNWTQTITSAGTNPATRTVGFMLRAKF
ncbi:SusC/RagA family TonB-linked outer membrane protein [Algoriphagus halophytocola]|uniref:SusC/RagA family TonB-linked outer membrane protein n=1 Tax=Algoriphagus halophytocola TaxID=2991499 RepID=A0ABY6MJV0_9BACT|nr:MULTISPECIES: SusC/RagA family TonB-linked outer membrane protein [unclassified Algoriphagus]UZD24057.1 SusC/RagA family TonB-linked outer membrane protein [Algoriphagus sp. TR-M5]WBL41429.1 SusC/RagA family TonB-linked outer membrane protein [Algoriphagus sp. TR-M9]